MKEQLRRRFYLTGQVQGVGFRPFVYRLALRHGLSGLVCNTGRGLLIEVQGRPGSLADFGRALREELPPLARIEGCREESLPLQTGANGFKILPSAPEASPGQSDGGALLTSPDVAVCPACLEEISDPSNRRHGYAFTNCTDCGPRYSIIADLPYDRPATSLACFPMCPACAAEYANPADRRFHAQPNACPLCGPTLWYSEAAAPGPDSRSNNCPTGPAALELAAQSLRQGKILAVKGLGGFHLACDATSEAAVALLRARKQRPHKPLALMAANLEQAAGLVRLDRRSRELLSAPERPILLCPPLVTEPGKGANQLIRLAPNLAPDTCRLGLMLPYTPLHHLLLEAVGRPLVMTSGNRSGEPIALGNREALTRLGGSAQTRLADGFLLHDRDILTRQDDSVLLPLPEGDDNGFITLRRARGLVPAPLDLPNHTDRKLLALGADLKNTVCLTRGSQAFVSQHIGDLQNLDNVAFQAASAVHLARLLRLQPDCLVTDSHPAFASNLAGGLSALPEDWAGLPRLQLQHHFAHAEAVLAENMDNPNLRADLASGAGALVLALDGSGYALDEGGQPAVWGGELLLLRPGAGPAEEHHRLGSLTPLDLPGGEAAIREPWRIAQALLCRLGLQADPEDLPWLPGHASTAALIPQMLEKGLNTPRSSGCGRVFDAASALLGLCLEITYEGQAAIRLETAQAGPEPAVGPDPRLDCPLLGAGQAGPLLLLDTRSLLRGLFEARQQGASPGSLARAFHQALAEGLANLALAGAELSGSRCVGLSGGVMQNLTLYSLLKDQLEQRGLRPLTHRQLPPNDACISYGQAVWAARQPF